MVKKLGHKGVMFIEYALILAFICLAGLVFLASDGLGASVGSIFGKTAVVLKGTKNLSSVDMDKIVAAILGAEDKIKGVSTTAGGDINKDRGFVRSGWPTTTGQDYSAIVNEALKGTGLSLDDLNATSWVLYNGECTSSKNKSNYYKPETDGLYWTDQDLSSLGLTKTTVANQWGSEQKINYYFYSTNDKKFYVVNGPAWVNQPDLNGQPTLAIWSKEYNKPAGTKSQGYDTYAELMASVGK